MSRLETTILEFDSYKAVELTVEEKEVNEFFFVTIDKAIVGLNEHKVLSEAKDEVAYIIGDAFIE